MRDTGRPFGYGLAVVSSVVMLALTALLPALASSARFSLLYAAVMMSSWYGGLGPGMASLVLCLAGSALHILPNAVVPGGTSEALTLVGGFLFVSSVIIVLNHARERAHRAQMVEREGRIASERLAGERAEQYVAERAERERAERGAQELRAILEGAPDAMVIADAEGRIALVNSQIDGLLGYRPTELLGQSIELLVPDRIRDVHPSFRLSYFGDPRIRPMGAGLELRARRKDGSEVPVEISLSPLDLDGTPSVIAAIRDVSDRKQLESERLQARAELERVRDDLTSMVVHDLKNPVNGIAMTARLALRKTDQLSDSQRRYFAQIERSTREMMRLIQNLLEIRKIEEGKMPLSCESIVLADLVREVTTEYEPMALETGKRLIVSVDCTLPAATADAALLQRVLVNLLANALRHSGGSEVRIEAAIAPGDAVTLRVIDDGRGIPVDDQIRIFEKFGSIRRSPTSEPTADTGLGLPFCKLAIERMGGTIHLTSRAGGPTVFAVTLPAPLT
jgi:protein-histidine pros-kinase